MKRCKNCKENLPVEPYYFYRNSRNHGDGFETVCRKCTLNRAKKRWYENIIQR